MILVFFVITFTVAFVALYSLYRQKKTQDVTNDFINNVTHEFKTPIATISLACEVLSDPSMLEDKDIRASYVEIINDENHERLMAFIEELSPLYKEVMVKYMIEELEYEEIAKELKLELNTVRTRIRRGKQQLAEMMLRGEIE